ncbi:MAG: serine acetyltransferase [Deltaproteobacteria bacterium]|jgi:serine O-acetyltransferase|nr:serine acetyltransferase [Deltaproteobacteria bacterium]
MAYSPLDTNCEYEVAEMKYQTEDGPNLDVLTEKLSAMRPQYQAFEYVSSVPRPTFQAARKIIRLSQQILFPGFFEPQQPTTDLGIKFSIGQILNNLFSLLSTQICASIRHDHVRYNSPCTNCHDQGRQLAMEFLHKLPELREVLACDVMAAKEGDPAAGNHLDQIILAYPGVYATMVYRLAHELWVRKVPFIPRIMTEYAHSHTGIDIHPGATIGPSFFIDHGTGVVIGETTVIGQHVRLYQGVTLGALSLPKNAGLTLMGHKRHPTIEDDVIIYSGATILGGETIIGSRSVVGGNVWLTESIPPDTKVFIKKPELVIINSSEPKYGPANPCPPNKELGERD